VGEPADPAVRYQVENGVGWIRLNRPHRRNALGTELLEALRDTVRQAVRDVGARVLVLTGEGPAFCAGADVNDLTRDGSGDALGDDYEALVTALRSAPKPTIAALRGAIAGIGVSIALCCDLRVAAQDAFFRMAVADLGLTVDGGATWLLPRVVGTARTFELCYTGRRLAAEEAERWGLLNQVVPTDDLEAAVRALAEPLARGSTAALAAVKRSILYGQDADFDDTARFELLLQRSLVRGADFHEGVAAFLAKRPPVF
jgi:2-(1,2-epoxy-1,2-dihydrophenyl)acetyl-CoA isomerase